MSDEQPREVRPDLLGRILGAVIAGVVNLILLGMWNTLGDMRDKMSEMAASQREATASFAAQINAIDLQIDRMTASQWTVSQHAEYARGVDQRLDDHARRLGVLEGRLEREQ